MTQPKLFTYPFAFVGDRNTIADIREAGDLAQKVNFSEGFPTITEQPKTAGGKPPLRKDFNGVFFDLTDNFKFLQSGKWYQFDADFAEVIGGYPKGAILETAGGVRYISLIDNNKSGIDEAIDPTKWAKVSITEADVKEIAWGEGETSSPWINHENMIDELDSRVFISPDLTFSVGGTLSISHSLETPYPTATAYLKCIDPEGGYSVGNIINVCFANDPATVNEGLGYIVNTNNNISVNIGINGMYPAIEKTGGQVFIPSPTKWKLIIKVTK